jgi:methyl-accepting chemotaxis protein
MAKEDTPKLNKRLKQAHFTAKELQLSIAVFTVIALLGGIILQSAATSLINYYGLATPFLGIVLIVGYIGIVVLIAIFFTHRLVGPFKRLEYEMKLVKNGELSRRLSVRTKDDLHIRNFVKYANEFIANFEEMSKDYNNLNSTVDVKLDEITRELSKETYDCEQLKAEVFELQGKIKALRERW